MTVGRKTAVMAAAGMAAAEVVYAAWVRPRLMRWGATDEEVTGAYPGADLVPGGERAATMAVTIDAPPDQVWPMQARMLAVLKRNIERAAQARTQTAPPERLPSPATAGAHPAASKPGSKPPAPDTKAHTHDHR